MKLFGWIQCKLSNGNAPMLKESGNGNISCLSLKPSRNNQQDYLRMKPMHGFEEYLNARKEEDEFGEVTEEDFPGFLAIGTLSMESMVSEPATPTFGFSAEETHDEENEEGNNDLKVINEELEKFFKVESENEWFGESKRRSEEDETFHPLEGYLFASSYDGSTFNEELKEEETTNLSVYVENKQNGSVLKKYKAATHHLRRMMHAFQPCYKKNEVVRDEASTKSSSTNRKFHKIKQLFRRKVHPEELRGVKESKSYNRYKIKENTDNRVHGNPKLSQNPITKMRCTSLKKCNEANVEHWIRSDADYLVLELGKK